MEFTSPQMAFQWQISTVQADLAKKAGLSLSELILIEAGRIEATWGTLRRLAYALDMDLPQLIQEGEMQGA